ncbi:MAG: DinB family protein [Ferruginibacter sp.]
MIAHLQQLFNRDLNKLKVEIESYSDEKLLWKVDKEITNSAGNLCLHLVGNLNTFIGKELGGTGYERNRPLEFSLKDVPRIELVKMIEDTALMVETTLTKLSEKQLDEIYPTEVFAKEMTTGYFLIHLAMHLSYHLGQINYHRRLPG